MYTQSCSISEEKRNKIREYFRTMESNHHPGPPESDKIVKTYLAERPEPFGSFINSVWEYSSEDVEKLVNPCTCEVIAEVHLPSDNKGAEAIKSAAAAFKEWSELSPQERSQHLLAISRNIQRKKELFAVAESICTGKPISRTRSHDIPFLVQCFSHFAGVAMLRKPPMNQLRPIGVAYIISACDNSPIMMCWHVSAALAMGNTVVLEVNVNSCLSAMLLCDVLQYSGLPAGVINFLPARSPGIYTFFKPELSGHMKLFFSGCPTMCQKLQSWSCREYVECELLTTSRPVSIVLEEADLSAAVSGVLDAFCFNDARCGSSGCLTLVQDSIFDSFLKKLLSSFGKLTCGNSLSNADVPGIRFGKTHCEKNHGVVMEETKKQNAKVISIKDYPSDTVLCSPPSLVWKIQTSSKIMSQETCGQNLLLIPFRTPKEAIDIYNHGKHGHVSVWSEKLPLVLEVAHKLKTGVVWANCQNVYDPRSCVGAFDRSVRGGALSLYHFMRHAKAWPVIPSDGPVCPNAPKYECQQCHKTYELFIGGKFKQPESNAYKTVYNCKDEPVAHVPQGSSKDIGNAVSAAVSAHAKWSRMSPCDRSETLYRVAENFERKSSEFASVLQEITHCSYEKCMEEVSLSLKTIHIWAARSCDISGSVQESHACGKLLMTSEPLGVVGIVCPDVYPLLSFVSLVIPAVAAGNAVVVLPHITCPIPALIACEVFQLSDVPAGVINVITCIDVSLGEHLMLHMEVDSVWTPADFMLLNKGVCRALALNPKHTYQYYDTGDDWTVTSEGRARQLLFHSTFSKATWLSAGDIFPG